VTRPGTEQEWLPPLRERENSRAFWSLVSRERDRPWVERMLRATPLLVANWPLPRSS
jgi:hypothetical protein